MAKEDPVETAEITRLPITKKVMRELMLASGGRCAMTHCGLPLISPSGGWIGTVAHIVAAEKDGPRGSGPETQEERRSLENLILMCATHGREVDAAETGEQDFPIPRLQRMKAEHEAKVSEAISQAIEQDRTGARRATGLIDLELREARVADTAEGLAASMMIDEDQEKMELEKALREIRSSLQRLSQPALDALAQLLGIWELDCRDDAESTYEFGDPSGPAPNVPLSTVHNRIKWGQDSNFSDATNELISHGLLEKVDDEYDQSRYLFEEPWGPLVYGTRNSFWICAASFLYYGHGASVSDWVRTLDFSFFDRHAPTTREVPWL